MYIKIVLKVSTSLCVDTLSLNVDQDATSLYEDQDKTSLKKKITILYVDLVGNCLYVDRDAPRLFVD